MEKNKKKKLNKRWVIPLAIVFAVALVSAIGYYAFVTINVSVTQPITISGELNQVSNCLAGETCLGSIIKVSNSADTPKTVRIMKSGNESIGVSYVGKLELTKKDTTTWLPLDDKVEITYTLVGDAFEITGIPSGYVLIYYKDGIVGLNERLNNPQPAISIIDGNLPQSDDANLNANYSQAPDYYEHSVGAKLWAVPSTALTGNVLDWSQMSNFYYETDLVYYFDNTDSELIIPAGSYLEFYPKFSPDEHLTTGEYPITLEIQ